MHAVLLFHQIMQSSGHIHSCSLLSHWAIVLFFCTISIFKKLNSLLLRNAIKLDINENRLFYSFQVNTQKNIEFRRGPIKVCLISGLSGRQRTGIISRSSRSRTGWKGSNRMMMAGGQTIAKPFSGKLAIIQVASYFGGPITKAVNVTGKNWSSHSLRRVLGIVFVLWWWDERNKWGTNFKAASAGQSSHPIRWAS